MHNISTELNRIVNHIAAAIDFTPPQSSGQLNNLRYELRKLRCPLVVYDFKQASLVFTNEQLTHWLGETQSPDLIQILYRSGCAKELGEYVLHFTNQAHSDLLGHYPLLKADGSTLLLYGCSRCISFDDKGKAQLIITLLCPVDYVYGLSLQNATIQNPALSDEELNRFETLTPREKEIMALMLNNKTDEEIMELLHISETTIRTHRSNLLKKLELNTVAALHRYVGLV